MWSKISSALKPREGNDSDPDHSDAQSTASCPPPDPFRVNAATYYTHQTPSIPPSGVHSRTASREEDIIWSLRTQLALQQEMCAQFEIDLGARDELVEALTTRLEASEKENDKRKNVIRSWKKKAAGLEEMCRHLEVEVEKSRQESTERSIMDEASGAALRQLHHQISQLEHERSNIEVERNALAQALGDAKAEIATLQGELSFAHEAKAEALRQLHGQVSQLEQVEAERNSLAQAMKKTEADVLRFKELSVTTEANREVQHQLQDQVSLLQRERRNIETERDNFSSEISRLRAHIQQLQKDSAAMEVTIVQLNKQLDQDKEDIGGLNIALESKQQELELVKRKHGARGSVGPTPGRENLAPSAAAQPTIQSSKVLRTSAVGARTSSPVPPRVPSALGRAANIRPPLSSALRRASSSSMESKIKPFSRRASIATIPSEADEKENDSTTVPLKHPRRMMVPA